MSMMSSLFLNSEMKTENEVLQNPNKQIEIKKQDCISIFNTTTIQIKKSYLNACIFFIILSFSKFSKI